LQALTLVGLAAIWLVPVGILSRALASTFLVNQPALRFLLFAAPGMWLFFPVTLLSSMGSLSRWQVLNMRVIGGLLALAPQLFVFYLLSGAVMLFALTVTYLAFSTSAGYTV